MAAKKADWTQRFKESREQGNGPAAAITPSSELELSNDVPLSRLVAAPWNARKRFDEESLHTLANSMRTHGQIEPIVVRRIEGRDGYFQVVAGERRLRAAKLAEFSSLKAEVRNLTDREARWVSLSENLNREDLNEYEEASALFEMIQLELHSNLEEVGKARAVISSIVPDAEPDDALYATLIAYRSKRKRPVPNDPFLRFLDSVLEKSGRVSTATFLERKVLALSMPDDLQREMQRGTISIAQATELQKVDGGYRADLLALSLNALPLSALRVLVKARTAEERTRLLELANSGVNEAKLIAELRRLREGPADDRRLLRRVRGVRRLLSDKSLANLDQRKRARLNELISSIEELLQ